MPGDKQSWPIDFPCRRVSASQCEHDTNSWSDSYRAAFDLKPVQLDSLDMRVAACHDKLSGKVPASIWFSSSPPFWNVHGSLSRMTLDTSHGISEAHQNGGMDNF